MLLLLLQIYFTVKFMLSEMSGSIVFILYDIYEPTCTSGSSSVVFYSKIMLLQKLAHSIECKLGSRDLLKICCQKKFSEISALYVCMKCVRLASIL